MKHDVLVSIVSAMFALLTLGLVHTQLLNYDTYYTLSQKNFIRILPIEAPRGRMLDRSGRVLVNNRLSLDVSCVYQEIGSKEKFIRTLSEILKISPKDAIRALDMSRQTPFVPVAIAEDVSKEDAVCLEESGSELRGLVIEPRSKRDYVYQDAGAHIFGYLGQISEEELERLKGYGYKMRRLVGRSGLEKYYDNYLAGSDGGEQVEVDSRGRRVGLLALREPVPGKDLSLTIDVRFQLLVDRLLKDRTGAAIVMDPRNGEILAMASHPSFDPGIFIKPKGKSERLRLLKDPGRPLINRAIAGLYAPGSIFKVAVAAGALDARRITRHTRFDCSAKFVLGNTTFHCWKEAGHGSQDVTEAIKNSCNVFFYNVGRLLGVDNMESSALKFGFGKPTGIDLPDEAGGLVPGRLWKVLVKKDAWYDGETVNYAIGQGYLVVTPIQVLKMTAAIANGGKAVRPHLVKRIGSVEVGSKRLEDLDISADSVRIVKEGMLKVVNDESGTGRRARVEGVLIGGKTGTAQNPKGVPHAWFAGFAPWDNPKICVVVMVEHGGKGGIEPAEMAKEVFKGATEWGYI